MRAFAASLLWLAVWCHPARADQQPTFYGKTVDGWIVLLRARTSSDDERRQAMLALGYFGRDAKAAVPDLIDSVRQGPFKREASEALARIEPHAEENLPRLIEQFLKEGCDHLTETGAIGYSTSVRDSLVRIGSPAVPALLDVLRGPDRKMRVCAADAIGRIGPAAKAAVLSLIRAIEHPDTDPHAEILGHYAVQALGRIGPEARAAVPFLNRLLDKEGGDDFDLVIALDGIGTPPVRKLLDAFLRKEPSYAAYQLAWLGPKARDAAPALRAALTDTRLQIRFSAAVALAHIDDSANEAILVLTDALHHLDDRELNLLEVPRTLARLGPRARAAIPVLIGLLKNGCDHGDVVKALVQIDPEGNESVPALVSALKHKEPEIVDAAARCLGLLGPRAKDAVPELVNVINCDFLRDDGIEQYVDPQVNAVKAIGRIGPRAGEAIPALIAALRGRPVGRPDGMKDAMARSNYSIETAAARVLGSFGPEAKAAVSALIEAVQTREPNDSNDDLRQAAILALGQIGADAKAALPTIRRMVISKDESSQCAVDSVIALCRLAPDGNAIAQKWLEQPIKKHPGLPRPQLDRRALVLAAMGRISFEGDLVTRSLLERSDSMLAFPDPRVDYSFDYLEEWIHELGRLGIAARLAIPRLTEFRKHPDPWVRMWAREALAKIQPAA